MFHNDESQIKYYLSLVSEVGCDLDLEAEVSSAMLLLQRLDKQRDLLSEGLKDCLSKHIITEIRSFMNPPEWVKTSWLSFVVSSVSLSLSHWYPGSGVVLDCIDS